VPWSDDRYPVSMKNLPPRVRHKAIEIANALLREGTPEGRAIRIGTWSARHWGAAGGRPPAARLRGPVNRRPEQSY
jgi:uncharacterized protein YdaT